MFSKRIARGILCVLFLAGLPMASWAEDVAPAAEQNVELAPGESADVSTEEQYEDVTLSPEEASPELAAQLELSDAVAAAANAGHNGWMLVCCALVLFMTAPGLALFYGGLVRKKNVVSVLMQCLFLMGLMSVVWAVCGFSLAFGGDGMENKFIGNGEFLFMEGLTMQGGALSYELGLDVSDLTFAIFQGMFFIITPALICGAFAERMKFSTMAVFSVLWGLLVYCPICHWVWDGGIIAHGVDGAWAGGGLDFAGGNVVHISSGISALVACILIGKRMGFGSEPMPPHNLTYTVLGAAMLWVGWFGFNAGSAVASNDGATMAFAVTHLSAAAGVIGWTLFEWAVHKKPTALGAASGAVAGLVCITPAAGFVQPMPAILMGFIAGVICFFAVTTMKSKLGYDDSLDAFGVHGIGGTVGAILTGVFATQQVTGATEPLGAIDGHGGAIVGQLVSVIVTVVYAAVVSYVLLKILDKVMGLRVDEESETRGLDLSEHGEEGYIWL
ncbi:MAG: ammonia channel protein [Rhodopirellula sp.]|nr:ammonia channel protein [Rhodopirellula sp.]|tara:strand:- start:6005 stop:7507 length:1503 start_codon:yes stop_codon:yes gene_type:complete